MESKLGLAGALLALGSAACAAETASDADATLPPTDVKMAPAAVARPSTPAPADHNYEAQRRLDFAGALASEVTVPKLDGSSNDGD